MVEPRGTTILILEDDPGVARLQQRRLERSGYAVVCTGTPAEALARIHAGGIDLLLLDYRLPDHVNGLDFYTRLKADGPDLPVILVTGFSDDATVIRALRAGVRDFVTKSPEYLDYLPEAARRVLEQVGVERQLAESEARLAAVIDSAFDAVLVLGEDQRVTLFNAAAERMFRCRAADALGRPVNRFIPEGVAAFEDGPDAEPSAGGEGPRRRIGSRELRGVRSDGAEFPLEASCSQAAVAGRMLSTIIVRDITDRKRDEETLREANRSLEKALVELEARNRDVQVMTQQLWQAAKLASVGELAASVAHELNNPLATVNLRVESVLAQTPAGDPRRRPLEIVEQEVERMGALVANLLQFSRRGADQVSTVDVAEELRKAIELVHHHLSKRSVAVVQQFAADLPAIYADRQKLRQVFLNLLTNAGDAMPEGGVLTLRAGRSELESGKPAVRIEFSDTGVGIPAEHLPRVSEPFFTTKEEGKGTGLGLAICRRVVQEHQGVMHITSEVGRGTTVHIALPVQNGVERPPARRPVSDRAV